MEKQQTIEKLQTMAREGNKPSEMLRFLVLDQGQEQQLELMLLFTQSFNCTLGELTAIGGWWHDSSAELNDNDIDAYITVVVRHWECYYRHDYTKPHLSNLN